jgi:hypothetical protein
MSDSVGTFHQFSRLPTELRLLVWRECLPYRVMELDHKPKRITYLYHLSAMRGINSVQDTDRDVTRINKAPPVLARVCCESRSVAFERGSPKDTQVDQSLGTHAVSRPWLDTDRDSVHLNYNLAHPYKSDDEHAEMLGSLMRHAALTKQGQASVMLDVLHTLCTPRSPQYNSGGQITSPSPDRSALANVLRTRESWTVVIVQPIIIYADVKTAAGLFGHLADAPVQLVHLEREELPKLEKFLALTERDVVDDLSRALIKLLGEITHLFGPWETVPAMRPAVMFRLCTKTGNSTGECDHF